MGVNVAVYFCRNRSAGKRLEAIIRKRVCDQEVRIYRTLDALNRRFRQPGRTVDILVLVPADGPDLEDLLQIRHLLMNVRIVLILPDRSGDTIAQGHAFYPRYVSYADGDLSDVAAVLDLGLRSVGRKTPKISRPESPDSINTGPYRQALFYNRIALW